MSQLLSGTIYTDTDPGDIVTSTNLNAAVNNATAYNGLVLDQQEKTVPLPGDFVLLGDSTLANTALPKKVQVSNLLVEAQRNGTNQWGGVNSGTANAIAVTLAPVPTAYAAGMVVRFQTGAAANTGAVTLNVNGLGALPLYNPAGLQLSTGDLPANSLVEALCNVSQFQVIGVVAVKAVNTYQLSEPARAGVVAYDGAATFAGNAYAMNPLDSSTAVAFTALYDGMLVRFKAAGANTGAATLAVNGLTTHPLVDSGGNALIGGEIANGQIVLAVYDLANTRWAMLGLRKHFISVPAALPGNSGVLTLAHGLGGKPSKVRTVLICLTSNLDYAPGDEVDIMAAQISSQIPWAVRCDATNIYISQQNSSSVALIPASGGNQNTIANGSWNLKVYAEI